MYHHDKRATPLALLVEIRLLSLHPKCLNKLVLGNYLITEPEAEVRHKSFVANTFYHGSVWLAHLCSSFSRLFWCSAEKLSALPRHESYPLINFLIFCFCLEQKRRSIPALVESILACLKPFILSGFAILRIVSSALFSSSPSVNTSNRIGAD